MHNCSEKHLKFVSVSHMIRLLLYEVCTNLKIQLMRRCHDQQQQKTAKVPCLTCARLPHIDYNLLPTLRDAMNNEEDQVEEEESDEEYLDNVGLQENGDDSEEDETTESEKDEDDSEDDDDSKDADNSGYNDDDDDDHDDDNDDSGGSLSGAVNESSNDYNSEEVQISDILSTTKSGRTCRTWKGRYLCYCFF